MSGGTCLLFKIKHGSSVHFCATASFMLFSQPKIILFEDFIISLINECYFYIFIIYYNVCFSAFKTKKKLCVMWQHPHPLNRTLMVLD